MPHTLSSAAHFADVAVWRYDGPHGQGDDDGQRVSAATAIHGSYCSIIIETTAIPTATPVIAPSAAAAEALIVSTEAPFPLANHRAMQILYVCNVGIDEQGVRDGESGQKTRT
jgi:hypothetical protein